MRMTTTVALGVAAALFLGACGSSTTKTASNGSSYGPTATASPTTSGAGETAGVQLVAADFSFTPVELTVANNSSIEVKNAGKVEHSFTIEGLKVNQDLSPGKSVKVAITGKPGTYQFHCEYHPTVMKGTITIS